MTKDLEELDRMLRYVWSVEHYKLSEEIRGEADGGDKISK
jgi:hypothetical protein